MTSPRWKVLNDCIGNNDKEGKDKLNVGVMKDLPTDIHPSSQLFALAGKPSLIVSMIKYARKRKTIGTVI